MYELVLSGVNAVMLRHVEKSTVVTQTVQMRIFTSEDHGPAGTAYGIGDKTVLHEGPLAGYPVYMGGLDQFVLVSADGLVSMVIRHNENDVGAVLRERAGNRKDQHPKEQFLHVVKSSYFVYTYQQIMSESFFPYFQV
jgi:hypothetical protein